VSQPALSKRLQALEQLAGVPLLERSARGVSLTPAGRRLYQEARRLLEQADAVSALMAGLRRDSGPVRVAASHSAAEAFAAGLNGPAVELLTANSSVVRGLVAEGRVDLGVVAARPSATPNPGVRTLPLAADAIVCAVPRGHPWAQRPRITQAEFLRTPMVMRDRGSNARWTVDAVLRERRLEAAPPLVEVPTPAAARCEALARNAPALLSRRVVDERFFVAVPVERLEFPRAFELVLPAVGEPPETVRAVIDAVGAKIVAAPAHSATSASSGAAARSSLRAISHIAGAPSSSPGAAKLAAVARLLPNAARSRCTTGPAASTSATLKATSSTRPIVAASRARGNPPWWGGVGYRVVSRRRRRARQLELIITPAAVPRA
jgi:DNA-binding transcriptional LysR family regulator